MRLDNIVKKYGDITVFDGFSAEFEDKGITWITGASGSGKTTLLRIIAGLEAYEGTISGKTGCCSFMFQEDRLFEQLSALDNIVITGVKAAEAEKYLLSSGLASSDIRRPVCELSGGMKRRTSLIRTMLYPKGEIILMDEPFNGLDEENVKKAAFIINELRRDRTLIAVTHNASHMEYVNFSEGNVISL